jgi:hypothetical protein
MAPYRPRRHHCQTPKSDICRRGFKSSSGLSRHRNSVHPPVSRHAQPARTPSPLQEPDDIPEQPEDPPFARQTKLHPTINGTLHYLSFRVFLAAFSYVFNRHTVRF